ncbi:MAG: hypothetical protein KBB55_01630 [Candidatus Buchananbacteria bacterium]|nr:hypothetical protein [Candidatus Buchananbacteria bacterium]
MPTINISTKSNLPDELAVAEVIKTLCDKYTIPTFTSEITIESGTRPHSHPVLTLNTRDPHELVVLKTLVHEQFHWYAQDHPNLNQVIEHLKTKYSDDGEHNKSGSYPDSYWEHIIVCFNTRKYLLETISAQDVEWIYNQWQAYPTLEKLIAEQYETFENELKQFDLIYKR